MSDTNNGYPKEQLELLQAIYDMRMAQIDFFRQPCDYRKKIAIRKEQILDSIMKPYLEAGLVTLRESQATPKSSLKQLDIFSKA